MSWYNVCIEPLFRAGDKSTLVFHEDPNGTVRKLFSNSKVKTICIDGIINPEEEIFSIPHKCTCCNGTLNGNSTINITHVEEISVIRNLTTKINRKWEFPYCSTCISHIKAYSSFSSKILKSYRQKSYSMMMKECSNPDLAVRFNGLHKIIDDSNLTEIPPMKIIFSGKPNYMPIDGISLLEKDDKNPSRLLSNKSFRKYFEFYFSNEDYADSFSDLNTCISFTRIES